MDITTMKYLQIEIKGLKQLKGWKVKKKSKQAKKQEKFIE